MRALRVAGVLATGAVVLPLVWAALLLLLLVQADQRSLAHRLRTLARLLAAGREPLGGGA